MFRAMAARFWSSASRRGSLICIDKLESNSITSTRRTLPSTVNARTGRISNARSIATNSARNPASVCRRHAVSVTGLARYIQ